MISFARIQIFFALTSFLAAPPALAQSHAEHCDIDGQPVPKNCFQNNMCGALSGMMECFSGDTLEGKWEIKNGKHSGFEASYDRMGHAEWTVDEAGHPIGVRKQFSLNNVLIMQYTLSSDHNPQGEYREFFPSGKPKKVEWVERGATFSATYLENGSLVSLVCSPQAQARLLEEKDLCGFNGQASSVKLSSPFNSGTAQVVSYLNGKRLDQTNYNAATGTASSEQKFDGKQISTKRYFPNGSVKAEIIENGKDMSKKEYFENGKVKLEVSYKGQWLDGTENHYNESGQLLQKSVWNNGELQAEDLFYLNGQRKFHMEAEKRGDQRIVHENSFYDNGKPEREMTYSEDRPDREGYAFFSDVEDNAGLVFLLFRDRNMIGDQHYYYDNGTLAEIATYDDKGRLQHDKTWDKSGSILHDDAVFEDGSRKSFLAH